MRKVLFDVVCLVLWMIFVAAILAPAFASV